MRCSRSPQRTSWLCRCCAARIPVAPEQIVTASCEAVNLLGPRSMEDIREAALATLAPPPERPHEFEALSGAISTARRSSLAEATRRGDAASRMIAARGRTRRPRNERRKAARSRRRSSNLRARIPAVEDEADAFRRALCRAPSRRAVRSAPCEALAGKLDLRRSLRRSCSQTAIYPRRCCAAGESARKLLLLIDVSGSMKLHTEGPLKSRMRSCSGADRAEVFTFGTRLTRITPSLRIRDRDSGAGARR